MRKLTKKLPQRPKLLLAAILWSVVSVLWILSLVLNFTTRTTSLDSNFFIGILAVAICLLQSVLGWYRFITYKP